MKKKISRKGYRMLAIVWTLAAASMAVAVVRRLAEFNLLLILLLILSTLTAAGFWKSYRMTTEDQDADPFCSPPKFADDPVLFEDDPPHTNQDSEEKNHER